MLPTFTRVDSVCLENGRISELRRMLGGAEVDGSCVLQPVHPANGGTLVVPCGLSEARQDWGTGRAGELCIHAMSNCWRAMEYNSPGARTYRHGEFLPWVELL
jgi:hypothetical protein